MQSLQQSNYFFRTLKQQIAVQYIDSSQHPFYSHNIVSYYTIYCFIGESFSYPRLFHVHKNGYSFCVYFSCFLSCYLLLHIFIIWSLSGILFEPSGKKFQLLFWMEPMLFIVPNSYALHSLSNNSKNSFSLLSTIPIFSFGIFHHLPYIPAALS